MRLLISLYTTVTSIHFVWYNRHVLDHLISVWTYIASLGHVSHLHTICTHYHFFVDPNATYGSSPSRQNVSKNNVALS